MRAAFLFALFLPCGGAALAADPPPVELTAEQDHQLMMDKLGISSHAPGRQWPRSERAECGQLR